MKNLIKLRTLATFLGLFMFACGPIVVEEGANPKEDDATKSERKFDVNLNMADGSVMDNVVINYVTGGYSGCPDTWRMEEGASGTVFTTNPDCEAPLAYESVNFTVDGETLTVEMGGEGVVDQSGRVWYFAMMGDGAHLLVGDRNEIDDDILIPGFSSNNVSVTVSEEGPACDAEDPFYYRIDHENNVVDVIFNAPEGGFSGEESFSWDTEYSDELLFSHAPNGDGVRIYIYENGEYELDEIGIHRGVSSCVITNMTLTWNFIEEEEEEEELEDDEIEVSCLREYMLTTTATWQRPQTCSWWGNDSVHTILGYECDVEQNENNLGTCYGTMSYEYELYGAFDIIKRDRRYDLNDEEDFHEHKCFERDFKVYYDYDDRVRCYQRDAGLDCFHLDTGMAQDVSDYSGEKPESIHILEQFEEIRCTDET